jgi:hypothetical protein
MLSPAERAMRGRIGGYRRWVTETDRTAATAPARSAFLRRFLDSTDPNLPMGIREKQAEAARRAHFTALAYLSARARSSRSERSRQARPHEPWANDVGTPTPGMAK